MLYKRDTTLINLTLKGKIFNSVNSMNVLEVIFDSKLSWEKHISYAITKAEKALKALRPHSYYNNIEGVCKL